MGAFTPKIHAWVLASEGGYVDHPKDPGGATNMGITFRTLQAWRQRPITKQDVKELTQEEALRIYKAQYWDAIKGDQLPAGVDYAVFDYTVHSGPAQAAKELQRVVGVNADGIIGAQTLAAVNQRPAVDIIRALFERRRAFIRGLRTYSTFGRGWENRIDRAEANALSLTGGSADAPVAASVGQAQPEKPSTLDALIKDPAGLSGIGSALAVVVGAIADQPILQIAAVVFIGILLWRFVLARKKESQ